MRDAPCTILRVQPLPTRRWHVVLFALLLIAVGAGVVQQYESFTFLHGDGAFYADMNRSILDGTLKQRAYQPHSWYEKPMGWNNELDQGWSNMAQGKDGTWWPKHPILLPILATPLYWLLGPAGALWANVLLLVFGLWSAARMASRLVDPTLAALTAMAFAALPLMTHSAYSYSNDVMYGALTVAGVDCFVGESFLLSGLLLGLAVWSKPPLAMFPGLLGLSLLLRRQWQPALRMVLGGLAPILAMLVQNTWMFGSPLTFSYDRILVTRGGKPALEAASVKMHRPFLAGLKSVWQDEGQGLVSQVSIGLGALLGVPWLVRRLPLIGATFLLTLCGFFVFYAKYEYTYARFYLPWLFLSIVPAALLLQQCADWFEGIAGWPKPRLIGLAVLLLVTLVVGVALSHRPKTRWSAVREITHATVERGTPPNTTPCDFFNPRWAKWECAQVDREPWQTWGLAENDQCRFEDAKAPHASPETPANREPWLWLHPNPGTARRIAFDHLPAGKLRLRYALGPQSHFPGLKFTLTTGKTPPQSLLVSDVGIVHTLLLDHGPSLTLEVPEQPADWRQFCVQMDVE
jgi:hypothetical protein